ICLPARMTAAYLAAFAAKREAEEAGFLAKIEQLERDRPALETEQKEIEAVPIEKRTKDQMDRLKVIERRLSGWIE
ncbi:hypothetical protein AB4144_64130, partial [Rhizobiaceae sp. 2RAB30]